MEHKKETAQARALRLLEAIYEHTVITGNPVHATKLAATIGSTEQEALAAWRYLKQRALINTHGDHVAGSASVNANGIDTIEKAKEQPTQPPPGFGSATYNTIHIEHMHGGGIAQAGAHSTQHQTITYNSKDFDDLRQAIEILGQRINELQLDAATKKKALAQIDTIKAQLRDEPNPTILKEAGRTLRNITEGAIGGVIGTAVPDHWPLVLGVLTRMFGLAVIPGAMQQDDL
jgi:hypothetical protein